MVTPFLSIEQAVKDLIVQKYPAAANKIGGDYRFKPGDDFYVWLSMVPGGSTDRINGTWTLDVDTFGATYAGTMTRALAIEAAILGPLRPTTTMIIDNVYQNTAPSERPWEDDSVFRIGATYVFTARRSG